MNLTNRRDFLKLAATASAAAAAGKAKPLYADSQEVLGTVRAWRTTSFEKFQPIQSPPQWETWSAVSALGIHLQPGRQYQEMIGFGGAFTDASCYLFSKLNPTDRDAILRELDRGGQVFYVHNRVETIEAQAEQLRRMLPGVRFVVGHGQMPEGSLEKVMMATRSAGVI